MKLCNIVHVGEFGRVNANKLGAMPKEKVEEFWKDYERWTRREEVDAALNNNQGIVLILDFDGFALKSYASSNGNQIST